MCVVVCVITSLDSLRACVGRAQAQQALKRSSLQVALFRVCRWVTSPVSLEACMPRTGIY